VRGIRNTSDFDYENLIQQVNVDVLHGARTLFVMPPRDLGSVSSSFIRSLLGPVGWHWSTRQFMPAPAYHAWILRWLRKEWTALWPDQAAERWFERLTGAQGYGGANRAYHNLDHLVHGLSEIRVWGANTGASARDVACLKTAFWFHDAVQGTPGRGENEELSAQLWLESGLGGADADDMSDDMSDDVAALIRLTAHGLESGGHRLADAMLGADLAILGQREDVYQRYADNVRCEYGHVPLPAYQLGRAAVLRHFLALEAIFTEPYFADLYEAQARANLEAELAALTTDEKA
jgi:pantetheine-phosphate adenylyltransferase